MNREILFRGKRVDNGEWIEGFYAECDERAFIMSEPYCDTSKHMLDGYWFGAFFEVIPSTRGQSTGLTDVNGVKIFEGDIVRTNLDYQLHTVEYVAENWYSYLFVNVKDNTVDCLYEYDDIEVVGNIHDNPELLEVSE